MSKKETKNTIKPHTEAKLEFYTKYLERYLPILSKAGSIHKINIYDPLCGQGIYEGGKKGSAIRTFEIINKIYGMKNNNGTEIALTLNDLNENYVERIERYLAGKNYEFEIGVNNENATTFIKKISKCINVQSTGTRNLIFIDPYGYKLITKSLIENLLKNKRTEVIIFLPIEQMYRFQSRTQDAEIPSGFRPLKNFIDEFGIDIANIHNSKNFILAIKKSLSFDDKYFSASYHIRNQQGGHYGLFFITSSIKGLEKIIEVKWQQDEQQGEGFDGQKQVDIFLETQKIDEFEKILIGYLNQNRDNREIYQFTLQNGFLPKHTKRVLKKLQDSSKLEIFPDDIRRGSFYITYENYKNDRIKISMRLIP